MANSRSDNNSTNGHGRSLGKRAREASLRLVRLYTFNTPIARGKYRMLLIALDLFGRDHDSLQGRSRDGREFCVNLSNGMQDVLYFVGDFERAITEIVRLLVKDGDVCIDVGANFGWYTTLLAKQIGPSGEVHAFEPVPGTFAELEQNIELAGNPSNVRLINAALGDEAGHVTLNFFEGEPSGHASMSSEGRAVAATFECPMFTLDSYLEDNAIGDIDFVKVDIEGAEMLFLRGAGKLFAQSRPPIFLMEMALFQTKNFGYSPDDLIKFIAAGGDYEFFSVQEDSGRLKEISGFESDDIGANVFCIPRIRGTAAIASLMDRAEISA